MVVRKSIIRKSSAAKKSYNIGKRKAVAWKSKKRRPFRAASVSIKKGARGPIYRKTYNKAYDQGFDQAYNEGYNVGYNEGLAHGQQEAAKGE